MIDAPSKKQDQFIVRLPDGMRDRIKAAAETNNRSMNADIVATLEEAYPAPPPPEYDPELLSRIMEKMSKLLAKDEMAITKEELREFSANFRRLSEHLKDTQASRPPFYEPLGAPPPGYRKPSDLKD